jgi:hypothetical protein
LLKVITSYFADRTEIYLFKWRMSHSLVRPVGSQFHYTSKLTLYSSTNSADPFCCLLTADGVAGMKHLEKKRVSW